MRYISRLMVALGLVIVLGCSSKPNFSESPPELTILQDVNDILHASVAGNRAPAQLADLNRQKAMFPRGYEAIKSGEIVVLWATPLQGEGEVGKNEAPIAYEKSVPANGGYVLLSAGTVQKMTAAEFEAAKKEAKK